MGYRLKELREEAGLTQEELAVKSGVSRVAISLIETGGIKNVSSKTLLSLASALNMTLDDFFGEDVKSI